jgi:hypothetical protein
MRDNFHAHILQYIIVKSNKKNEKKKDFALAQYLLQPVILADCARFLPFWQVALSAVLAVANRPVWVVQSPVVGVELLLLSLGDSHQTLEV